MSNPSAMRPGETFFSLLLVVFSVTAFWQSYAISGFTGLATAGVFPMLASATMTVASIFILLTGMLRPREVSIGKALTQESTTNNTETSEPGFQGFVESIVPVRLVIVVLLISGYVFAMPIIGFLAASAVFLFLSFSYLWRKSMLISLIVTLVSVVSVYFIFRQLFQVVLPNGTLFTGWF